jgi:serine/threonine protein kinase
MSDIEIGFGSQGHVTIHEFESSKCAVKKIYEKIVYERERDVLLKLQHIPGVIKLIKHNDESQELFLELGYGDAWKYVMDFRINRLTNDEVHDLIIQLITTVIQIHKSGIVHRDINPSNIIIIIDPEHSAQLRLCDFGFAVAVNSEMEIVGTDNYIAPELVAMETDAIVKVEERQDAYSVARVWSWLLQYTEKSDIGKKDKLMIKALVRDRDLEFSLGPLCSP